MALIKTSALISSLSGSAGGSVFSGGRSGQTMRSAPCKVNQNSMPQSNSRAITHYLQQFYAGMAEGYRLDWNRLAIFHNVKMKRNSSRRLSGQELFVKWNFYRLFMGYSLSYYPSMYNMVVPVVAASLSIISGACWITTDYVVHDTYNAICIFVSKPISGGRTNVGNQYRLLKITTGHNIYKWNIHSELIRCFGKTPAVAMRYKVKLLYIGMNSPWFSGFQYYDLTIS
jgi:hypothetical protein